MLLKPCGKLTLSVTVGTGMERASMGQVVFLTVMRVF